MKATALYSELKATLKTSDGTDRKQWAIQVVEEGIALKTLLPLLQEDKTTAMRCSWLLSDIGEVSPEVLLEALPALFDQKGATNVPHFEQQMVKYWRITGVPLEQEGYVIDMIFTWLHDPQVSTHIKTVSLDVLEVLLKKYPELKNELQLWVEQQEQEELPASLQKAVARVRNKWLK